MSHRATVLEGRLDNIISGFRLATTMLNELNHAFGSSSMMLAISNTTLSLIHTLQNVKKNKLECIELMEGIHQVLYAIMHLYIKSDTPGSLPPVILDHIGKFTQTTHKIHTFLKAQQDGNKIRNFFRQSEMSSLLKDCRASLQHATEVFKIQTLPNVLMDANAMKTIAATMHEEMLEMISTLSEGTDSDQESSMYPTVSNLSQLSSKSFSMLPSKPKIFHGRESELDSIVEMLTQECPRIAILGAGGMGKTSLARAALHHADVVSVYEHRLFVPCDSVTTSIGISALIGDHIGLKPGKDLTQPLLRYFAARPTCLLILDNLETTWEPLDSRGGVEELLCKLTDITHLALLITMRGAERPAKVRWTQPFLPPLQPLSDEAARRIFFDIADDDHETTHLDHVLRLTNNMPLAVDLIAHLVDYEGCSSVLSRWGAEKTSVLSVGHDRRSNLDVSIEISLSSTRLTSSPGALDLLKILSLLPDGLSDTELRQSSLPIQDVLTCKAVLLSTSLAYQDDKRRLKLLVPIREYMQHFHPPASSLIKSLQKYFHMILDLYQKYHGSLQMATSISQINSNFGNLNQILLQGLQADDPDSGDVIMCTLSLGLFTRLTGRGWLSLMDHIPAAMSQTSNHDLEVRYITEIFLSCRVKQIHNADLLASQAGSHFDHFDDPLLELRFYRGLGYYYGATNNSAQATKFLGKALVLAKLSEATMDQIKILNDLANLKCRMGEYTSAQPVAIEAKQLAQLTSNLYEEAIALRSEVDCCIALGDFWYGAFLVRSARELLRLCGMSDSNMDHVIMTTEADVHMLKSEYAEAQKILNQIAQSTSPEQDVINYAFTLLSTAEIDMAVRGSDHDMAQKLDQAKMLFTSANYIEGIVLCEINLASLRLREGDVLTAQAIFQKYLVWPWTENDQISSYCREHMSDIDRWGSSYVNQTSTWAVIYLAHAKTFHTKLELYKAIQFLGKISLQNGEEFTAGSLFTVALSGFTYMDVHRSRADCMLCLGDLAQKQGKFDKASTLWKKARPLFERSSQALGISKIDSRLAELEKQHGADLENHAVLNLPIVPLKPTIIVPESLDVGE